MKRKSGRKEKAQDTSGEQENGAETANEIQDVEASDEERMSEDDSPPEPKKKKGDKRKSEKNASDEEQASDTDNPPEPKKKKGDKRKSEKNLSEEDNASDADAPAETKKKRGRKSASPKKSKKEPPKEKEEEERSDEEEEQYEVEEIIDEKVVRGVIHYLIRWKGYDPESDTWEPENTLECPDLIKKFKNERSNDENESPRRGRKNIEETPVSSKRGKKREELPEWSNAETCRETRQ
uniref:Chromo domain-containing protein n=1 Tax=Photinus pyralis TaxID=7054 RepID=A0A1Y1K501_PHOPY